MAMVDEVLDTVVTLPGATFRDIHDLHPGVGQGSLASALHTLVTSGKIIRELINNPRPQPVTGGGGWRSKVYAYSPNPNPAPAPAAAQPKMKRKKPTEAGLQATVSLLREQVAELEAWKADAIRRHPDLAVSPVVLKARALAARKFPDKANEIHSGRMDDKPLIQVIVEALEEVV